ncbi:XTP/dITP diphosphatase [Atopobacter sp. AH10]|uniref:XTP/dITP diphosphatase n=1 Tax=Atopobacter sp. AH10 TaxID=2315861 RepID=UPI000EF22022|nr:XTP/dITP diphosphatase [Atopobacter sp. AH10]RLK63965.1 XTP/dITP diphosphatase [Atopobacter sp. AH10]
MSEEKVILIATHNKGKVAEFEQLFKGFGYRVESLIDYPDLPDVIENGSTFEENARLKAEEIAKLTKRLVISDDSGLCVDSLAGQPGVLSARYAGEHGNDALNNAKLLAELGDIPNLSRRAHFHCSMVAAREGYESLATQGQVFGQIASCPRGEAGFGYDVLFIPDGYDITFAEMPAEDKNALSHRAKAIMSLMEKLPTWEGFLGE